MDFCPQSFSFFCERLFIPRELIHLSLQFVPDKLRFAFQLSLQIDFLFHHFVELLLQRVRYVFLFRVYLEHQILLLQRHRLDPAHQRVRDVLLLLLHLRHERGTLRFYRRVFLDQLRVLLLLLFQLTLELIQRRFQLCDVNHDFLLIFDRFQ